MLLPAPNQSENIENNEWFFKFYTLTNDSRFFVQHKVLTAPYRQKIRWIWKTISSEVCKTWSEFFFVCFDYFFFCSCCCLYKKM